MRATSRQLLVWAWLLLPAALPARAQGAGELPGTQAAVEAHARFLSDDLLEGRAIGSRGGQLAVLYAESVLRAAGLQPLDGGSFRQPVPLVACDVDEGATLTVTTGQVTRTLVFSEELVVTNCGLAAGSWGGQPLFVGYGISAPALGWDDYRGVDVTGRLLIGLANEPGRDDPAVFRGPALTRHGRWSSKLEEAARRGAVGMLLIHTDADAGYSWDVVRNGRGSGVLKLAEEPGILPLQGWLREAAARELLRLGGADLDELRRQAERRAFTPVPIPVDLRLSSRYSPHEVTACNVVGVLPGSDQTLRDRAIVLTAHHDHLGVAGPGEGDRIYNGAVDNAAAVAVLLAVAQHYGQHPERARATLVFAVVDAEEQGLLGSLFYTRHPPLPLARTLANINFEMPNVWGRTRDVVAIGAEMSSLEGLLRGVLARHGMSLTPDPAPEQGMLYRSDQYALARAGVPAVWLNGGVEHLGRPVGWGRARLAAYRAHDYHQVSDEIGADWEFGGLAQLAELTCELIAAIESAGHVEWNADADFSRPPSP